MTQDALHLVCPHCHTTNRLAADRLGEAPNCGKCHRPPFTGHSVALDEAAFEKHVARSQIPVLVDFWAPWCGPCRMISPVYEELASGAGDGTTFLKVDVDDQPEVAAAAGVTAMPTFKFFKDGQLLDTIVGADAAKLQSLTKEHLS